ncbi:hypothetical protein MtrunA17_Chr1g0161221 [Medicago truncatula]|uniref:Uncharacterized protein n=1 Tax=Medicago truncatula TaxID=3880 RepID=G8A010_MEDTR|nr:hypothetical protein MTR_1g032090 [Medicago truncatula]RHN78043.1 hypothetical protein MtrunA17_Chr1g0161221 [Medicago truncatula]
MEKSPHLFMIHTDITLSELKDRLDQINRQLNHRDTRRMDDVEYRRPSIDSVETVRFSRMKLKNNNDMRTIFSIFGQYNSKGSIEFDASLIRYVENITLTNLTWMFEY